MSKKKKCKCKKHGKKDCPKCFQFGSYYFTGAAGKKQLKMICEMVEKGINVYHLNGKPGGCPIGGCQ
jgi:hypothetical protein